VKKGECSCFNSEYSKTKIRWISGSFRSLSAFWNEYLALVQNLKEATTDSNSKEHDNERTIQWIILTHEFHGIPQGSSINA